MKPLSEKSTVTVGVFLIVLSSIFSAINLLKSFATQADVEYRNKVVHDRIDHAEQRLDKIVDRLDKIYELLSSQKHR